MNSIPELYFTDKDLFERWERVKTDFWGDLKHETLLSVKRLLETGMEIEVQDITSARRWQHVAKRADYRNGSYERSLWTVYGWINNIKVPRVRSGGIEYKTFKRYQCRSCEVNSMVLDVASHQSGPSIVPPIRTHPFQVVF